jgi:uncharacterized phage infection (PIP) family protein YhgE
MDSTDFYQIEINEPVKPINHSVHMFVIGLMFGANIAILLTTAIRVMDWCSDPLAGKLQDKINDLNEENDVHLSTIRDLEEQVEDLTEQVESLTEELEEESEENGELHDLINELTNDLDSYRKKTRSLREKVADLREIARIQREVDVDSDESPHKRRRVGDNK